MTSRWRRCGIKTSRGRQHDAILTSGVDGISLAKKTRGVKTWRMQQKYRNTKMAIRRHLPAGTDLVILISGGYPATWRKLDYAICHVVRSPPFTYRWTAVLTYKSLLDSDCLLYGSLALTSHCVVSLRFGFARPCFLSESTFTVKSILSSQNSSLVISGKL